MLNIKPIGANQTELHANGMLVLFSYQTPVAAYIDYTYYKTDKKFSKTTSKHINTWLDGSLAIEKPQDFMDNLIKQFKIEV